MENYTSTGGTYSVLRLVIFAKSLGSGPLNPLLSMYLMKWWTFNISYANTNISSFLFFTLIYCKYKLKTTYTSGKLLFFFAFIKSGTKLRIPNRCDKFLEIILRLWNLILQKSKWILHIQLLQQSKTPNCTGNAPRESVCTQTSENISVTINYFTELFLLIRPPMQVPTERERSLLTDKSN